MTPDKGDRTIVPWLVLVLLAASVVFLWPFTSWILFAIWASALVWPVHGWLARHLGHRPRLAAIATTLGLVVVVAPLIVLLAGDVIAVQPLTTDAIREPTQTAARAMRGARQANAIITTPIAFVGRYGTTSHGHTGVRRLILGSVAETMLHQAHRAVLVARESRS